MRCSFLDRRLGINARRGYKTACERENACSGVVGNAIFFWLQMAYFRGKGGGVDVSGGNYGQSESASV